MSDIFMKGAILTVGGRVHKICAQGRVFRFEMHSHLGPMPVDRHGSGINAPMCFWEAVTFWAQQGQRVNEGGFCMWDQVIESKPITKHIGGRNYLVTGYTEEKRIAMPESDRRKNLKKGKG